MKKIIIFMLSLFILSCENNAVNKVNEQSEIVNKKQEHQQNDSNTIHLNNSKKWKVDDKMLVHIRNMENDINSFENTSNTDYKELVKKLQSNLDLLTTNCTMKGQAHDELHKWLLPYIDLVNVFSETKNKQELVVQFQKIQASFLTFNQYFH